LLFPRGAIERAHGTPETFEIAQKDLD